MENEVQFKGSQLETEIRNTNDSDKLKIIYKLTYNARENQPTSEYWKEAFDMIFNKLK
jgi:hypothetical protein